MPRQARIVIPGTPHHITQRGNNRQIVFEEDGDYLKYCFWINKYASLNGLDILAYCLMENHVHFIVLPSDQESLSKTFQMTHMRYAQYMNKKRASSGHLWQGRFYSCAMDDRHFYQAVRYVERNPMRSSLVKQAWDYCWSSASWHVNPTEKSMICLRSNSIAEPSEWKEYLTETDPQFEQDFRAKTRKGQTPRNSELINE